MTASVNKRVNHRQGTVLQRNNVLIMHVTLPVAHKHACVLNFVYTAVQPAAYCTDKCARLCVRACRCTDSLILEAVITGIVQIKCHSLPEPALHEREASLTLEREKREKKKQLPRYSTSLQSGLQYLCNTHPGMLKNLKLDQFKEYLCNA